MSRTPLSAPATSALAALLISSTLVARLAVNLKSTRETFGVGTRTATPSSLPFSSGSTRPTAFAAPVEVGIMESAAARAVEVLVQLIQHRLVVGVAVNRGHEALRDADHFVHDHCDRRETVG